MTGFVDRLQDVALAIDDRDLGTMIRQCRLQISKLTEHIAKCIHSVASRDRDEIRPVFDRETILKPGRNGPGPNSTGSQHRRPDDLTQVSTLDDLARLTHTRVLTSLQTDKSLDALGFGESGQFFRLLEVRREGPFDENVLVGFKSRLDQLCMQRYLDRHSHQIDVGVRGEGCRISVRGDFAWDLLIFDGFLGRGLAAVLQGTDRVVR